MIPGIFILTTIRNGFLNKMQARWLNRLERPNGSTNNGDMGENAKRNKREGVSE